MATILMIFWKSTAQISADWYGAALPYFRLVWQPLPALLQQCISGVTY